MPLDYESILEDGVIISIVVTLISLTDVFVAFGIIASSYIAYSFIPTLFTRPSEFRGRVEDGKLESFIREYENSDFTIRYWDRPMGGVIRRYASSNIYLVPKGLNRSQSMCCLAHEIGHAIGEHHLKKLVIRLSSILILSFIVYHSGFLLPIMLSICSVILTLVSNYFNHKYEYRADHIANQMMPTESIVKRLRTDNYQEIRKNSYMPYIHKYPKIASRVRRIRDS